MKIGMLFPGYGNQFVGMCKELYDSSRRMQEFFEEAANCLNVNIIKLCYASSDSELSKITNATPTIFVISAAIAQLLKDAGIEPNIIAGYNIGEFTALWKSQALTFPDALYVLNKYTTLYQELLDNQKDVGALRITGIPCQEIEELCNTIRQDGTSIYYAIRYSDQEHYVVGLEPALQKLQEQLSCHKTVKIKQAPLELGLHCALMEPVVSRLSLHLEKIDFHAIQIPLISSTQGSPTINAQDARTLLLSHINSPVNWGNTIAQFESCDLIIITGPGNSLQTSLEACYPDKRIITVNKLEDIELCASLCGAQTTSTESSNEHI